MKNLSIFLLFFLASTIAFGQGVPAPATPRPMVDKAGNLLSDTSPAPVKLIGTSSGESAILGSIATATANYTTIQTSSITVTDTSANISALTNRDFITLQNVGTGTIYLNIGGTPATSAGYRLYSQGSISIQKIAAAVPISVISATSESNELKIVQGAK